MSGIAGILHLDGSPVDRSFVSAMADALAFRGPDAQNIWTDGPVGFAHTLLATTFESEGERQPSTLDGQVWIVADARIDGRQDLARKLCLPQSALLRPDCELILHAYARWGEICVDHLLGDFAFAIWDGRARKLFCARDHFGVKPFFYSSVGEKFLFSNTLNCVRLHQGVSDELNELAIADFLVFGFNQDVTATTFLDIKRLPAANVLTTAGGTSTRRYWSLPVGEQIRYRRSGDYVEHFRELLEAATADRLRAKRVAVWMSGGMDSTSVAAFARKAEPVLDLEAHTSICDSLIPDNERHFAELAATALGMRIHYKPYDDAKPFDPTLPADSPEPANDPFHGFTVEWVRRIALDARILLTGHGPDALFSLSPLTTWDSVRAIPLTDFVCNMARYALDQRRVPRFRLRSSVLTLLRGPDEYPMNIPEWLEEGLTKRCRIADRVRSGEYAVPASTGLRPLCRSYMSNAFWPWVFETHDAACIDATVEFRHPYFDCRLVRWLLAIPELPYSMDKWLLRMALRGMLPNAVRTRPKTPVRGNPVFAAFQKQGTDVRLPSAPHAALRRFVNSAVILPLDANTTGARLWTDSRPISLNRWLRYLERGKRHAERRL